MFLEACTKSGTGSSPSATPSLTIASPKSPVTWDIPKDSPPIADGLAPENNATLQLYSYADYVSPDAVKSFEQQYNTKVQVSTFNDTDEAITKIRGGNVEQARRLLAAPYRIRGMVTHGAGRGAKIGFPTANLGAIDTLLPAQGVYAGRAWLREASRVVPNPGSQSWPAAINVGPRPTFDESAVRVEAHLIGLHEALYGQVLEIDFVSRLRDIRPFDSPEALAEQLQRDVEETKRVANS